MMLNNSREKSRKHFSPRFFEEIRFEYEASRSSGEKYKTTFVHFMLGGEAASDIGGNSPNLNRTGGLLNAAWESRLKAADALKHPWLQKHAKGLVCDKKQGTMKSQSEMHSSKFENPRKIKAGRPTQNEGGRFGFLNKKCSRRRGRGLFGFLYARAPPTTLH